VNAMLHPSEFGSYGAAELKAVARTHLSRALALGSGAWILLFALAAIVAATIGVRPPVLMPMPPCSPERFRIHEEFHMAATGHHAPRLPRENARPNPVAEEPPLPEAESAAQPDGPGSISGAAENPHEAVEPGAVPPPETIPDQSGWVVNDVEPQVTFRVEPKYPDLARSAGVEGAVLVLALVDRNGLVARSEIRHSVPMLDEAALEAVRRWKFMPALASGHPVAVWVAIRLRFSLHD
jgi:protein TonB